LFTVTIRHGADTVQRRYDEPVLASRVLEDAGIPQSRPCGGKGICGKCRIRLDSREVLACKTYIEHDAVISTIRDAHSVQGITAGALREFERAPLVSRGYGAAIDIGTTTVAGYVYEFPSCTVVRSACVPNPQAEYGADVISRIEHAGRGSADALAEAVHGALRRLTSDYSIEKAVICGNTTMMYLLTRRDPSALAVAPYHAEHLFGEWAENAYLVPCISAYVGGDMTAAILAAEAADADASLLIDIGTNGEMALRRGDSLLCCSTAAGPCFEGAGIRCGMPAATGAISDVSVSGGELVFRTVDGAPPAGICGTGLVDAVAALLELGVIDETGYMEDDFYFGGSDVFLTPEDVRKFQLAKSAIRSGIDTLLHRAGIGYGDVHSFFIAGGFGYYLNTARAARTGLIPAELAEIAKPIGNGAGIGASMILQSSVCLAEAEEIAKRAKTVSLAADAVFGEKYMENMMFEG